MAALQDYCPGGDLFGAIMTKRFYGDIPAIKSIIIQLAEALQFLHSISIFHRDLKPENVLITSQRGEPPRVAIADFGLSSDVPMASIELGSIHYMSPGASVMPFCIAALLISLRLRMPRQVWQVLPRVQLRGDRCLGSRGRDTRSSPRSCASME